MERTELVKMAEDIAKYVNKEWIANLDRPQDFSANDVMFAMGLATGMLGYSIGQVMVKHGAEPYSIK